MHFRAMAFQSMHPSYQFVEGEYMKLEEYEDFFRDPSDFWLRIYLPRDFRRL